MRLQPREKTLLGVMFLVLVALGLWKGALEAMWDRYLDASGFVATVSAKLTDAEALLAKANVIRQEYTELTRVLEALKPVAPGDDAGAAAIRRLGEIAAGVGVALQEIKPGTTGKSGGTFSTLAISVKGAGRYEGVYSFLNRIQTDEPVYEVTRISMSPTNNASQGVEFSLTLIAKTYRSQEVKRI